MRGVEWGGSVVCCEGEVGGVWRCLLPGVGAGMWRAESPPWLETERGERRGTVDRDQVRSPHIATPQPAVSQTGTEEGIIFSDQNQTRGP